MNRLLIAGAALLSGVASAQNPPAAGAGAQIDRALHTLVATQGDVRVKRKGWTDYGVAGFGTAVRRGDLIRLGAAARATVTCTDLAVRELPAGKISGVPCAESQVPLLVYEGSLLNPTRAALPADIPVVLAPRRTKLLSPRPTLRWQLPPGVTSFQVRVSGPGFNWSANVSDAASLIYPADAPTLLAGSTYKVSVVAGGRSSDELSEPGLGFTLLDAAAAQKVRADGERVRALQLPAEATQLLMAQLYAARGLHAEATEQLESLAKSQTATAVWRALGLEYQAVGLNELAEQNNLKAVRRARETGDIEGQALALQALGYLYRDAFGLPKDARDSFRSALALFQKLGAPTAVKEVQHALADDDAR